YSTLTAWGLDAGGFALGAVLYYGMALRLDQAGAAVRLPTRFADYALSVKQKETEALIGLLARCDLLRHLPPEDIETILPMIRRRALEAGEILFRAGDPGDALYIVAQGGVEVLADGAGEEPGQPISRLGEGQAFGEMALLSGHARTATIRAVED